MLGYTVFRRCHLPGRGVRQRIEVSYTYQAVDWKVLLPSALDSFCAPLVIRCRGKNSNQSVHNSRIDYCNSGFSSVALSHLRPLQSVQNAAARLIVKKRKYIPITDTIRDVLHWLPIQQRIEYKLCDLAYKSMHHTAPISLTEQCDPVSIH